MNEQNIIDAVEDLKKVKDESIESYNKLAIAKSLYKQAMRRAQANFKKVNKGGYNDYIAKKAANASSAKYATYEDIFDCVYNYLAEEGFTFDHNVINEDGFCFLETECYHDAGYSKYSTYPLIPLKDINLTLMQQMGSGITYAKKYNLAALSAMSRDGLGDDDAQSLVAKKPSLISSTHLQQLKKVLTELPPHVESKILESYKIATLKDLELVNFSKVYNKLQKNLEVQNETN